MHLETTSFFGRTVSPHNINLSSDGSSGGESVLIALRGSVLGVTSNGGGSIRGASTFCGIYGFKPSTYTHQLKGFLGGFAEGGLNIVCSLGPMRTSFRDVDFFMATIPPARPYWTFSSFQPTEFP
ncbi:amidase signature domain-containing protein [Ilyonectria sp. MPI-CAGE-AT-0026]|nr:amidase signature domain-containing protein [Ilyonectria sp. MPI-CAGE-AT-0026]